MANRRGFLGLFAGGIAAGPSMAKQAVAELATLNPGSMLGMGSIAQVGHSNDYGEAVEETDSSGPYKKSGPYLRARSKNRGEYIRNNMIDAYYRHPKAIAHDRLVYRVEALSPHIAGMRSISMVNKIRMSREDQHDYWRHMEMRRYELELEGVYDDESDLIRDAAELVGNYDDLPKTLAVKLSKALQYKLPFKRK